MDKYHVAVAAEALAAAAFAREGYEVSVQYGANQPGYDLVAVKGRRLLKVSVKGSQDGGWALLAGYKRGRTWRAAVDAWRSAQPRDVIMCFVQFQGIRRYEMPLIYLARPSQVAAHLKRGRNGHVGTCLHVERYYAKGVAKGHTDRIPTSWTCSRIRMRKI
jgi:Holliday junction resolvase-like predicted endonuclease